MRRLLAAALMKIEKLLTDNGSQFTDRFTCKDTKPSGNHAFDRWSNVFNGRINDVLATTRFRSRDDLQTTIVRYVKLYNEHLPQKTLGNRTPLQAMRAWRQKRPDLFTKRD